MFLARRHQRQIQMPSNPRTNHPKPNRSLAQIYKSRSSFLRFIRRRPRRFFFSILHLRHPPRTLPRLPIHPPPLPEHNHKRRLPRTPIHQRRHTPLRVDEIVQRTPVVDGAPLSFARDGGVTSACARCGEGTGVDVVGVRLWTAVGATSDRICGGGGGDGDGCFR